MQAAAAAGSVAAEHAIIAVWRATGGVQPRMAGQVAILHSGRPPPCGRVRSGAIMQSRRSGECE